MNYDRVILELMNRIQVLEQQVSALQMQFGSGEQDDDDGDSEHGGELGRIEAREKAMAAIKEHWPEYLVERASRKEGSGIKLIKSEPGFEGAIIIKFSHSRVYHHPVRGPHGWHTVNLNDIIGTVVDFVMFSVTAPDGRLYFLIFKPSELGEYRDQHRSRDTDLLHLYFTVEGGRAREIRETTVDVTDHLNNWDILR